MLQKVSRNTRKPLTPYWLCNGKHVGRDVILSHDELILFTKIYVKRKLRSPFRASRIGNFLNEANAAKKLAAIRRKAAANAR